MRKSTKETKVLTAKEGARSLEAKFYSQIRDVVRQARNKAYRSVNFIMVEAYWNIGRLIVEEEQNGKRRADYGEYLIELLADRLTSEFGKGFAKSNLWYMRQFFHAFPILHALRGELSWTHYRLLLKVEDENVRRYYMEEAAAGNWSTRQLDRQINTLYYERLMASREKKP